MSQSATRANIGVHGRAAQLHLVWRFFWGVTLIIVPGQPLARSQRASQGNWDALAQPMPRGYYAVVTPSAQQTALIERLVRERIDWGA